MCGVEVTAAAAGVYYPGPWACSAGVAAASWGVAPLGASWPCAGARGLEGASSSGGPLGQRWALAGERGPQEAWKVELKQRKLMLVGEMLRYIYTVSYW